MLGNASEGVLGHILAFMLCRIYSFLYRPDSIVNVFSEFDTYIYNMFTKGWFTSIFDMVKVIGLGLLVVSFLISLMDKVSAGDFSIQNFFVHWLRFFILYILLNYSMDILKYFLEISSDVFNSLNTTLASELNMDLGVEVNQQYLACGINRYMGIVTKLGMFMIALIPFVVSYLFSIIIYFFAVSRLMELTIRIAMSPIIVGISYLVPGLQSDFTRYAKRTLGACFQIVVVLLISLGLTVTHTAQVDVHTANPSTKIGNPAVELQLDLDIREIKVNGAWRRAMATNIIDNFYDPAYSEESIGTFVSEMFDTDSFFVSTGIMLAGIFMLFKSREISNQAFS